MTDWNALVSEGMDRFIEQHVPRYRRIEWDADKQLLFRPGQLIWIDDTAIGMNRVQVIIEDVAIDGTVTVHAMPPPKAEDRVGGKWMREAILNHTVDVCDDVAPGMINPATPTT